MLNSNGYKINYMYIMTIYIVLIHKHTKIIFAHKAAGKSNMLCRNEMPFQDLFTSARTVHVGTLITSTDFDTSYVRRNVSVINPVLPED